MSRHPRGNLSEKIAKFRDLQVKMLAGSRLLLLRETRKKLLRSPQTFGQECVAKTYST
jgi:hypothetical protein